MPDSFVFSKSNGIKTDCDLKDALEAAKDKQNVVWINLCHPDPDDLKLLGDALNIHELTIEDLDSPRVRPKVEEFEDHLFIVFKAFNLNEELDVFERMNLNLLLFKNLLISSYREPIHIIENVIADVKKRPAILQRGADFLLYTILDAVVDTYFPFLDELDDATDEIETKIFSKFDPSISESIFKLKNKVTHLRRLLGPKREMLNNLISRQHPQIQQKTQIYLRDVYDHVIRVNDYLESYREILQGAMESYITQTSNRMSEVMKTLSVIATTMLPLGILTGLYGTNFENLPGAKGEHSFYVFVAIMMSVLLGAAIYFKSKKWF